MVYTLYQSLGNKEGERNIYKLAKVRERKTRNLVLGKCVGDEMVKFWLWSKTSKKDRSVTFTNYIMKDKRLFCTVIG